MNINGKALERENRAYDVKISYSAINHLAINLWNISVLNISTLYQWAMIIKNIILYLYTFTTGILKGRTSTK